jgi:hypothetical protein
MPSTRYACPILEDKVLFSEIERLSRQIEFLNLIKTTRARIALVCSGFKTAYLPE